MDTPFLPRIVSADRISGDLLIVFNDERTVLFSAAFLYGAISQAQEVFDPGPADYTQADLLTEA